MATKAELEERVTVLEAVLEEAFDLIHDALVTFPRFHRHLYKEEQDEIGGQDEHQDQTAVYGRV